LQDGSATDILRAEIRTEALPEIPNPCRKPQSAASAAYLLHPRLPWPELSMTGAVSYRHYR
jgi:hypothetical protein